VRAYAARTGLAGHTRNSITDLPRSSASSRGSPVRHRARRRELELGVRCMAAGILDDQGKLVAGCRSRRRPIGWRKAGWSGCARPRRRSRRPSGTAAEPRRRRGVRAWAWRRRASARPVPPTR
jgi:hypothetical protein